MATYCISDIHGNINLWHQIKDFINPKEDKLICLGDCADRGLDGWEIITDVLCGVHEGWITYVRGNHEQMLINALDDYINYDGMCDYAFYLLCQNGGYETFTAATNDGFMPNWLVLLKKTIPFYIYENIEGKKIFLSHAGLSWNAIRHFENGQFDKESQEMKDYLRKELIWNRKHNIDYKSCEFDYQVYGHTPIPYISSEEEFIKDPGVMYSHNGHNINIDCGTYATNITICFDLDAFDEHIFQTR